MTDDGYLPPDTSPRLLWVLPSEDEPIHLPIKVFPPVLASDVKLPHSEEPRPLSVEQRP